MDIGHAPTKGPIKGPTKGLKRCPMDNCTNFNQLRVKYFPKRASLGFSRPRWRSRVYCGGWWWLGALATHGKAPSSPNWALLARGQQPHLCRNISRTAINNLIIIWKARWDICYSSWLISSIQFKSLIQRLINFSFSAWFNSIAILRPGRDGGPHRTPCQNIE